MDTVITIYTHPDCLLHDTGLHVEQPDRLRYVMKTIKADFPDVPIVQATAANRDYIQFVHTHAYLDTLHQLSPLKKSIALDGGDTVMSPRSLDAAYLAAGAAIQATIDVANQKTKRAFCAIRPPGHHAEPNQAMGFCLFNNVAVAAKVALNVLNFNKVAIIDFDVHHGNGTQTVAQTDPRILFISSHEKGNYPGTGFESDHDKYQNIYNFPLPAHTDSTQIKKVYTDKVFPALTEFAPQLLFISAGFDAHEYDQLSSFRLQSDDYQWLTQGLVDIANNCAQGRVVSVLEGGYNLNALAESVGFHLQALSER